MRGNNLGQYGESVASFLRRSPYICTVDLSNNFFGEFGPAVVAEFAKSSFVHNQVKLQNIISSSIECFSDKLVDYVGEYLDCPAVEVIC